MHCVLHLRLVLLQKQLQQLLVLLTMPSLM
jgi:hypothetical protein